jgi:hypothetical protein
MRHRVNGQVVLLCMPNSTVLENNVLYARLRLQHEVTDECAC